MTSVVHCGGGGRHAMMGSYEHLLDRNVTTHTWMIFPHSWSRYGDWPDLAACRAPSPLLVQYDLDDALFTVDAMRASHQRIAMHYAAAGRPEAYVGEFYVRFVLPKRAWWSGMGG